MKNLLSHHRTIEVHSFRNLLNVPTLSVTIEYHLSFTDKLMGNKPKVRKFVKSEGTPWHEQKDSTYVPNASVVNRLLLEEICSNFGYHVPHD